ncbi:hypothetical protein CPB83DRAFT_900428 [Crepidotus variabilis]|uniref:C2H2-type domain-containing protein n=1 Tax=Crepidotus variabilis TaxID=179855 RepID=A0A9P6E367_9AGAR|nr:hypothetical protein CPB83DRAFT_900428 [Crepidotus variabilis]
MPDGPPKSKFPCPICAKKFASQDSVERHISQPLSRCRYIFEDVMHYSQQNVANPSISPPNSSNSPNLHPSVSPLSFQPNDSPEMDVDLEIYNTGDGDGQVPTTSTNENIFVDKPAISLAQGPLPSPHHIEKHPNSSNIDHNRRGKTFMNVFKEDEHHSKRKTNTYYPFASQLEWQLASFLLKSSLSMAALDEFLKLDIMSWICITPPPTFN